MKNAIVILLLLNSLGDIVTGSLVTGSTDALVSVAVLFRHGDRAPKTSFPTDAYYDLSYWPMGFKQLTNKGKKRHYELGKWFRNRYDSFLPATYSSNDIYIRSSDVDRTLMSAAADLAGLYPPTESQVWTEDLNWQPIPIHTLPKKEDLVISMKKKCKKYNKAFKALGKTDFFVNITKQYADLFDYISTQTGWEVDDISFIQDLWNIFYTYREYNASFIPSWADDLDVVTMDYLNGLAFAKDTYTEELKRLRIGPFFDYLFTQFDNVMDNDEDTAKFLMLSGHESTVASVLNGMGVYDYLQPEFACAVIWELKVTEDGTYYINMYYKKEDSLQAIGIDGCGLNCKYDTFKKLLEPITISDSDWEDECG